jgi:hypothetical protein
MIKRLISICEKSALFSAIMCKRFLKKCDKVRKNRDGKAEVSGDEGDHCG